MFNDEFVDGLAKAHVPRLMELLDQRLKAPTAQRWMDRKQAAQYLGKTERSIRALAEDGHIKEYGPNRAVLYDKEEIDRVMLESGRYVINGKRTHDDGTEEPEPSITAQIVSVLPPLPLLAFGNDETAHARYHQFRNDMFSRLMLADDAESDPSAKEFLRLVAAEQATEEKYSDQLRKFVTALFAGDDKKADKIERELTQ